MGWKHCIVPLGESCERIRDGFDLLAAAARGSAEVALFTRATTDHRGHVLLLSPRGVELARDALSARWTDCGDPGVYEWNLVQGALGSNELLGLHRPFFSRIAAGHEAALLAG